MEAWGVLLTIGASFFALGVVFWGTGFLIGRGLRRGWHQTTGHWRRFESGLTTAWQVEYLAGDGEIYWIMPVMNSLTIGHSGTIPVAYDPARPRRAVIDTFYYRGGVMKVVGGATMGVALVVVSLGLAWMMR